MATPNNSWSTGSPHPASQLAGGDDMGLQERPMGLKVHYTFDRDNQVHCLARWPHILSIQTVPVDERNTIGVVDLQTCLQAIAQCSPEIVNQQESDYTVYAYDYSEPDLPLVGQGMLSWGLEQNNDQQQQQLVTGRVTRNLMAILSNGSRETLEVKLKLTAVAKMQRTTFPSMDSLNMMQSARTPTADPTTSEWNSFLQSNPALGHSANVVSMPSPALPPAQLHSSMSDNRFMDTRNDYGHQHQHPVRPASIPLANPMSSLGHRPASIPPTASNMSSKPAATGDNAPSPAGLQPTEVVIEKPVRPSRPSSRASRSRVPTGRPRGRPRKKPLETGNTSAAEEATDGDDGPQRKRAKVTKAEYSNIAPFGSAPDSLRVAASTSGSLRNMRPVGAGGDAPVANHLQDIPRAPTPIPDAPLLHKQHMRRALENNTKSDSVVEMEGASTYQSRFGQPAMQRSMSRDARSPSESIGQSPDQGYTPEDSPADLGSSPPVPRTTAYLRSSPMASSPILPTMPMPQVDSGFMSGGIDDFFEDEEFLLPQGQIQDLPGQTQHQVVHAPPQLMGSKPGSQKNSCAPQQRHSNFPFQEVNPGPPELLPTTSIFNPAGKAKTLNRPQAASSVPPPAKKAASRPLKRSNTAPTPAVSEFDMVPQELSATQHQIPETSHEVCEPQPEQVLLQPPQLEEQSPPSDPQSCLHPPLLEVAGNEVAEISQQEPVIPEPTLPEVSTAFVETIPLPEAPATEPILTLPTQPTSRPASRHVSRDPPAHLVTASDPAAESTLTLPRAYMSEAPCPPSDCGDPPRYNKNQVKKQSIKERLETAIQKGEQPPFCNNCGAIETPTWRKIWTQNHDGVPGFHEFSDKPGFVTMIEVLERDAEGKPKTYQLVKKNLGPRDNKKLWKETLLCNRKFLCTLRTIKRWLTEPACGIWLAKFKSHRPPDRWDKDAARLNQPRKKREAKSRSKKARTKSDAQMNPTSEAYFTTDPIGPADQDSPKGSRNENDGPSRRQSLAPVEENDESQTLYEDILNSRSSPKKRGLGSTHSRGSGTADSPIAVDESLGATRRLLFPSPRKDGAPKVLGELAVNVVQTATIIHEIKSTRTKTDKENTNSSSQITTRPCTPVLEDHDDLEQELFGTPPNRPSTPPHKNASSGVFKTPTRPTPSHRPITRSISKSIRTVRTIPKSPGVRVCCRRTRGHPLKHHGPPPRPQITTASCSAEASAAARATTVNSRSTMRTLCWMTATSYS
ncbi:hypothetical protein B0T17DRAFT_41811 [Bombardia bombarda]|uniref:Ams2/SPT21 N-terminal domain-containing protein n=1 Tax=Bombardia bombarda TaxID=252184 RepID=A0AA40CE46_9PEZI|nr:hypothetical protein B0T17DRAFT_41811 [Bombardia bombarda]